MSITTENIEIWRPVCVSPGVFSDLYKVSNKGYFKNSKGGILKGCLSPEGYIRVKIKINKDDDFKTYTAGRLVYQSFNINEDITEYDIEYLNNDSNDLNISNLKKSTRTESTRHDKQKTKIRINNNTGHTGIYPYKGKKNNFLGFRCSVYKDGVKIKDKRFKTIEEALYYRDN
jgi:hypothetical protein